MLKKAYMIKKCPSIFLHLFPTLSQYKIEFKYSNIHNFCPSCFYMIHILFFCKLWNKSGREILQLFSFKTLQIFLASIFFLTSRHLLCNIDTVSLHICYKFYRLKNFKTGARIIFILILQQNLFVANFKGR